MKQRLSAIAVFCCLAVGCAPPQAVKEYTDATRTTAAAIPPVARDYAASCHERGDLAPPGATAKNCAVEDRNAVALTNLSKLLKSYADALAALNEGSVTAYEPLDGLGESVKSLPGFKDVTRVSAVTALAKTLATWATRAYQDREIAHALSASDADVTSVSNGLADSIQVIADDWYGDELQAVRQQTSRVGPPPNDGTELATWIMFRDAQSRKAAGVVAKQDATRALVGPVKKIGTAHAELTKNANNLSASEAEAAAKQFAADAKTTYETIHDAFGAK